MKSQKNSPSLARLALPSLLLAVLLIASCKQAASDLTEVPAISFTGLSANGVANAETSTELTLTFSEDPGNLRLSNLTVVGAAKGILSGTGNTRTLTISRISVRDGESVSVSINKTPSGYRMDPPSRSTAVHVAPPVIRFLSLTCSGFSNYLTTQSIILTFDSQIPNFSPRNIQIQGATLYPYQNYQDGGVYHIGVYDLTVANGEQITITLPQYMGGARIEPRTLSAPAWIGTDTIVGLRSLTANGVSNYQTTDTLTLNFYGNPGNSLTADTITLTGATLVNVNPCSGNYQSGIFSQTLSIKDITVQDGEEIILDISANLNGIMINPLRKNVKVFKRFPDIAFTGLAANGETNSQSTTMLTLYFDKDPQELSTEDIVLTGATKGVLTGEGNERVLEINNITVFDGENVTVRLLDISSGYFFTPNERSVSVSNAPIPVNFMSLAANGESGAVTTTELELTFDGNPATLKLQDITVTGARLVGMSGSGNGITLFITDITGENLSNVTVAIANPVRYAITPSSRTVAIHKAPPVAVDFTSLIPNGTPGKTTTTELTLNFNQDPTTLRLGHITVIGARATGLSGSGTSRTLAISDVPAVDGDISVRLANPYGYSFTTPERTVTPNHFRVPMVSIPGGTFQRNADAANLSEVSAFYIGTHEVTAEQYMKVTGRPNPTWDYATMTDAPVQNIEWHDAIAFCNLLSEREGLEPVYSINGSTLITGKDIVAADWNANGYRLPTEMEWMWAAMGALSDSRPGAVSGTTNLTGYSKEFSGSNGTNTIALFAHYPQPPTRLSPVGQKLPNELGLYDMSGNVAEYTWDSLAAYPAGTLLNYRGSQTWSDSKVSKGGSFGHFQTDATIAFRMNWDINSKGLIQGFRIARNAE